MLACRLCRVPLAATAGCAACDPVRRNLVVVGEDDADRPSLSGTGNEVVAVLRRQLADVKRELEADPGSGYHETRLLKIGNTAAKVLEAARKLQADGVSAVESMSFAERAELFISWFSSLPPAYRMAMTEKMAAWEAQVAMPVARSAEDN
jgi:hypothetical protein